MSYEAKQPMEYMPAFPLGETGLLPTSSEPFEIMSLISRRSSPGVVLIGQKGEILLMNQQADEILKKIQGKGQGRFSKTEEGKLVKRLHQLRLKVLDASKPGDRVEAAPVCDLLPLRGTTFSLRGIVLEGAGQEQAPVMVLIEPIQERSGSSPAVSSDEIKLTKREEEICNLIGRGLINKEIASALGIGLHTVKDHIKKIMKKLKANTRAGIVAKIAVGGQTNGAGPAR